MNLSPLAQFWPQFRKAALMAIGTTCVREKCWCEFKVAGEAEVQQFRKAALMAIGTTCVWKGKEQPGEISTSWQIHHKGGRKNG
jgi:hypothetical protein